MDNTPPGWIPHGNPSVDPNVHTTLDDIKDDDAITVSYTHLTLPTNREV